MAGAEISIHAASEIASLYRDDERSITEKYGQMLAPYFRLVITSKDDRVLFSAGNIANAGGYDLDGLIVSDVSMEEDIEGADAISITVQNPRVDLQNSMLFDVGNNIDLFMGYDGRPSFYMMRGIIVEVQPEFPADSIPTIKITAYDKSYFMMEEGKAEIVPEGSAWWERRRRASVGRQPLRDRIVYNNAFSTNRLSDEEVAENRRIEDLAAAQGVDVTPRLVGGEDAPDSLEQSVTRIGAGSVIDDHAADAMFDAANEQIQGSTGARGQLTWQRQRFGRRRRRAGKVWRGKTDSEIVAAIFISYGITPYVEATHERRRLSTNRSRPRARNSNGDSETTGRPSTRGTTTYRNLENQVEVSEAERERIEFGQDYGLSREDGEPHELDRPRDSVEASDLDSYNNNDPTSLGFFLHDVETGTGNRGVGGSRTLRTDVPWVNIASDPLYLSEEPDEGPNEIFLGYHDDTPPQVQNRASPVTRRLREVVQKAGTTDWDFIKKLAEKHDFILFVFYHLETARWIGYWGPESNVPQFRQYTFRYNDGPNTTLGTLRPNTSARNQSTEIDLIYVDPVNGRENRLRVAMDNLSEYTDGIRGQGDSYQTNDPVGEGPEVVLRIHGQRVSVNADRRFTSAEDARRWLMSYWLSRAKDFYVIEGDTIIGIPEMRAREHHFLYGIGRYSGEFFITQATHSMSPGQIYKTTFVGRAKTAALGTDEMGDDMLVVDQQTLGESQPEPESDPAL